MLRLGMIALGVLAGVAPAFGQTYTLDAESRLTQKYCLPPCTCVPYEFSGPVTGSFQLTLTGSDPQYTYYAVGMVGWTAIVNGTTLPISGTGQYKISKPIAIWQRMELDLVVGTEPVRHYDSGVVAVGVHHMFPEIQITLQNEVVECTQNVFEILAIPSACNPDCNGDGVLDISDFGCFTNKFLLGDPYTDCNGDGVLDISDFGCYTNLFILGCP